MGTRFRREIEVSRSTPKIPIPPGWLEPGPGRRARIGVEIELVGGELRVRPLRKPEGVIDPTAERRA
jgi:hypothetical protein